jgi:histidinol-phosphate phosphatase family protein
MKAAVFFERDGILNRYPTKESSQAKSESKPRSRLSPEGPCRLEQFQVCEEVIPLLVQLKKAGFLLLCTTNQPAVARGEMSRSELDLMHRILMHKLPLDDISLCASDDPSHPCYKPQPGMFTEAAFKWGLDLDRCFVVSDKWSDAKAAQIVGCTSIMIDSPWVGDDHHDYVVPNLEMATHKILQLDAELHRMVVTV